MNTPLQAIELLKNVQFPGDDDPTYTIAISTPQNRKNVVTTHKGTTEESKVAAVIEIQRVWRGYRTRGHIKRILGSLHSDDLSRDSHVTSNPTTLREYVKSAKRSAIDKQDWVFEMLSKNQPTSTAIRTYARVPSYDSHMTGHIVNSEQSPSSILRQKMMLHSNIPGHQSHDGHVTITAPPPSVRGYHPAIKEEREWTMESATVAIQRAWRRYSDIRVFKYYKDLLIFSAKPDPRQILKSINPIEGKMIDGASGGFVRFRLGGDKFPPTIYYKIFTHRSIVDMCAFSPRDYTDMRERRRLGRDLHNKDPRVPSAKPHLLKGERGGWYERVENNEWRPLSEKSPVASKGMILLSDSSTSPKKPATFSHLKSKRKEEVKVMKKRRKIKWMMQMYKAGMREEEGVSAPYATPNGTNPNTPLSVARETYNLMNSYEGTSGTDIDGLLEDDEIEDLLQWTMELNYDQYLQYWGELATSYIES